MITKMQAALGGALVLLGVVAYARTKTAAKGPGSVGITVECDPATPGSCSGDAASATGPLNDAGVEPWVFFHPSDTGTTTSDANSTDPYIGNFLL